jgi:hypothetical protein
MGAEPMRFVRRACSHPLASDLRGEDKVAVARASPPRGSVVVQPSYQRGTGVTTVVNTRRLSERLKAEMRKGNGEWREEGL